jgi:outer-membrane receptor for ferric coprogen and ferric-rhodotorulic acid
MNTSLFAPRATPVSAAISIALLLGGTAAAQSDSAQTMSKIKVQADSTSTEGTYTVDSSSSATGLDLFVRDTPQSITVITRERIDDQAMTTVADALRNTTGVSLKPIDRGRNNLSVRGFDVNNFQLDGAPVTTGNVGLETTNTAIYDRVEVVRGATGLLSGAGDPSASVNLVRKHADSDVLTGALSVEAGSWDQRAGTIDVTTPLSANGAVRGRFVASAGEQDAFIDLEHTQYDVFYAIVDADLGERTRLNVGAGQQRDERRGVMWAGLPYWYSDGTRASWDRSDTTATRWNRWDTTDRSAFATLEHRLSDRWTVRGDVSYHEQEEESMLLWMSGDPDRLTGEGMEAAPYHYLAEPEQLHTSLRTTGLFDLFGRQHEIVIGLMRSTLEDGWSNRDALEPLLAFDINSWDGSYAEPAMGERYITSQGKTTQTALYTATRLQLADAFKVIAGARISDWKRDEKAAAWSTAYVLEESNVFTPYAGVVYDLNDQISAYASYTDSFKPQTNRDRNGRYLDPLQGNSYEVGLKSEWFDGRLFASAAVFRIEQDNFAVPDVGQPPLPNGDLPYRAAQGTKSEGYELEAIGELATDWYVSIGWTKYSAKDAEGIDVAVDHAREQLKLFTKYTLPGALRALTIGAGLNWEGDRPARAENPGTGVEEKVGQPSFALVDLMASYDIRESLSLQVNVNNALDKKYRYGSSWWGAPLTFGEPREILVTMEYGF